MGTKEQLPYKRLKLLAPSLTPDFSTRLSWSLAMLFVYSCETKGLAVREILYYLGHKNFLFAGTALLQK